MRDKVLNIIRETLLHESEVESFTFDFESGLARLSIAQLRDDGGYPHHDLELSFAGIQGFSLSSQETGLRIPNALLGIECSREADVYRATVSVGVLGNPVVWTLALTFTDLTFKRHRYE